MAQRIDKQEVEIPFEKLQPWSTFVMKSKLPSSILEKMLRITDNLVENKESDSHSLDAGQIYDQFYIDQKTLIQEEVEEFFIETCKNYVIQAFLQAQPPNKKKILEEEFYVRLNSMWVNCQKDNEYFPPHVHTECHLSSVMYLKIPKFLPSRIPYNMEEDGCILFTNNSSRDMIWGRPTMIIQPEVGDFLIFPATLQHQVFPFRTLDGKGERRSISFNAEFTSKSEQDFIKENGSLRPGGRPRQYQRQSSTIGETNE